VELKITASKIGFVKVELAGEQLLMLFPPPEEIEFYDGQDSRFQKIAARMHELTQFNPRLKQDGKQLKLIARIKQEGEPKDRIAQINTYLQMLER
jgi:hypothetical protein